MSSPTAMKSNICFLKRIKWGKTKLCFIIICIILVFLYLCSIQSSRTEVFFKRVILKTPQNSQEKTCKKKRIWHRCFPKNFVKFLKTYFFIDHLQWLLQLSRDATHIFSAIFIHNIHVFLIRNRFTRNSSQIDL